MSEQQKKRGYSKLDDSVVKELLRLAIHPLHHRKAFHELQQDARFTVIQSIPESKVEAARQKHYYIKRQTRDGLKELCRKYKVPIADKALGTPFNLSILLKQY